MFMLNGRSANSYPWIEEIDFENGRAKRRSILKYLSVMVVEYRSFEDHIAVISTKLAKNIGILQKL